VDVRVIENNGKVIEVSANNNFTVMVMERPANEEVPFSATHCNTLQHTLQHILQHTAAFCNSLCNTLQHTATHCNTLQHTATHCNTANSNITGMVMHRCANKAVPLEIFISLF